MIRAAMRRIDDGEYRVLRAIIIGSAIKKNYAEHGFLTFIVLSFYYGLSCGGFLQLATSQR